MNEQAFFLQQKHHDFDAFCENARHWDLDYRQLDAGKYTSELLMFGDASTLFTRAKIERSMLQKGASPAGLITFGLLAKPDISIHWRNIDIRGNQLFVFPPNGELHSITHSNFEVFTLSFDERTLDQSCTALELPDYRILLSAHEVFNCHPEHMTQLRNSLHNFALDLICNRSILIDRTRIQQLKEILANYLILALNESTGVIYIPPARKRDQALKLAVNYIEESEFPVSSVQALCSATKVSWRTLEYAFHERYGQSPKAFMISHYLNKVRKTLRLADPDTTRICEIAGHHGFWHMGQFAADYRRLFRELPSETLRNK